MNRPIDDVYDLLIRQQKEIIKKRNDAVLSGNEEQSHYLLGYLDALRLMERKIKPLSPQEHLNLDEETAASMTTDGVKPLAETENLPPSDLTTGEQADGHRVTVSTAELTAALRRMTRFRKKAARKEMVAITFREGVLRFSMNRASEGVSAEGVWSSDIIVSGHILYNCAAVPTQDETVLIQISGEMLFIGTAGTPVHLG